MKKLVFILLIFILMFSSVAFASLTEVNVKLNEHYLASDAPHVIQDGRTFVVARSLVEALGGQIFWDDVYKKVSIFYGEDLIELYIGSETAYVNGGPYTMDVAPFINDGRTMIPLRFVSETLGCEVGWDDVSKTASIVREGIVVPTEYIADQKPVEVSPYTEEDLYWLSKIVTVESGDQSMEMAIGIANVVLNRVKSDLFPDTVHDVIFQVDVYKQFPPAHKSSFETLVPSEMATEAARRALQGENNVETCLFFNNQPFKSKTDDLFKIIDGEYFYY